MSTHIGRTDATSTMPTLAQPYLFRPSTYPRSSHRLTGNFYHNITHIQSTRIHKRHFNAKPRNCRAKDPTLVTSSDQTIYSPRVIPRFQRLAGNFNLKTLYTSARVLKRHFNVKPRNCRATASTQSTRLATNWPNQTNINRTTILRPLSLSASGLRQRTYIKAKPRNCRANDPTLVTSSDQI